MNRFFCLMLVFWAGWAGAASYVVPAGGTPAASSAFYDLTMLLPTNSFPWTYKQIAIGKPLRIAGFGDSVGYRTGEQFWEMLRPYYGYAGSALNGGNLMSYSTSGNTVTNRAADTNWWADHFDIANGGYIVTSNLFNSGGPNGVILADTLEAYVICFTNAGAGAGFNLMVATNGGTFYATQSIQTVSATLTGKVFTVTLPRGLWQGRIQCTNGYVKTAGMALYDSTAPGVRPTIQTSAGIPISSYTAVSNSVGLPFLRALKPDLLFIESTADTPEGQMYNALTNWETTFGFALTNTDVVYLGTPPIDTNTFGAFNEQTQNASMRQAAVQFGRKYFDQSVISGTYSNMQYMGWSGDGIHRTNILDRLFASKLCQAMGLGDRFEAGAMVAPSHVNSFTATQFVRAPLVVGGSAGAGYFLDQNSSFGDLYGGKLYASGAKFIISLVSSGVSFDLLALNAGYGQWEPASSDRRWGHLEIPFELVGSNNWFRGVSTNWDGVQVGVPGAANLIVETNVIGASNVLTFPQVSAQADTNLTITLTGAAQTDIVTLGVPAQAMVAGVIFQAFASNDVVYVRCLNASSTAKTPGSGLFKVSVRKIK